MIPTIVRARRIGLISDTHGHLRPEAVAALHGSELILHAGDIGGADLIAGLETIAPVIAVRGNNDRAPWAAAIPERQMVDVGWARMLLLHDLGELDDSVAVGGCQVVVSGHSHRPRIEHRGDVLLVNPGSAGPRRFKLPISVGRIEPGSAGIHAEIIELPV